MNNADQTKVSPQNDVQKVVMHHLASFQNNDMIELMSDYTSGSVLITRDATYNGQVEIEAFLRGLMLHFPKNNSKLDLDKIVVNGKLAYIVWHAKTPSVEVSLGSDTFIIKDGKIHQQTFAGQMTFIEQ